MTIAKPVDDETRARLISELEKRVALARARARVLTAIAVTNVCLVVIAALTFGALVLRDKIQAERTNGQRISALTAELTEARDQLAAADATTLQRTQCAERYGSTVSAGLSEVLAYVADLAIAPTQQIADAFDAANGRYKQAITDRAAWQDADSPLPCPLTSSS